MGAANDQVVPGVTSRNASFPIGPFRSARNRSLAESQYVYTSALLFLRKLSELRPHRARTEDSAYADGGYVLTFVTGGPVQSPVAIRSEIARPAWPVTAEPNA